MDSSDYKYTPLFVETLNTLLASMGVKQMEVPYYLLPLGISYFTFQFIHVLVEVHRGSIERPRLLDLALFTLFFPTILSGPIKRFGLFISHDPASFMFDKDRFLKNLGRVLLGMSKKMILANTLYPLSLSLQSPEGSSALGLAVAIFMYTLYIYFDFSGYSDMAIGSAGLLGYRVEENFQWPYLKSNPSDFWKSWHMSLTRWIQDYCFIPLGGSRGQFWKVARNTMITMGVIGIWHGAAWNFLVWGLYHGVILVVYRVYRMKIGVRLDQYPHLLPWRKVVGGLTTFCFIAAGWVFFACDWETACAVFLRITGVK